MREEVDSLCNWFKIPEARAYTLGSRFRHLGKWQWLDEDHWKFMFYGSTMN